MTTTADPPFDNNSAADVIIRSSDNVDFYVFKSLLVHSSPIFKHMCVSQREPEKGELKNGIQVIVTEDDSETWKIILRFLYPLYAAGRPALYSLDEFSRVMAVSNKYAMMDVENLIVEDLISPRFLKNESMRVFALAYQFDLEAEARVAAKHTLRIPLLGRPYVDEMDRMTVRVYLQLQEYH
jgi:hypothetical protein